MISGLVFPWRSRAAALADCVLATSLSLEEGLGLAITTGLALKELLVTDPALGIKVGDLSRALLLEVATLVAIVPTLVIDTIAVTDNDAATAGDEGVLGLLHLRRFGAHGLDITGLAFWQTSISTYRPPVSCFSDDWSLKKTSFSPQ